MGFVLIFLMIGCGSPSPKVINNMSDASYQLVNQDSAVVTFPGDFKGRPMIVAYIYTTCKTVCPAITANMKNISREISGDQEGRFVLISFDPSRDRPSQLRAYRKKFELDPRNLPCSPAIPRR